jgi:hypothetical protein
MKLSDEDLDAFQNIWEGAFHETIPIEEARRIASDVMELYSLLALPIDQRSQPDADGNIPTDEIFSLLQKVERERGSPGPLD